MARKTPLYEAHRALGARLVDFAGWEMPVQYTSVIAEHEAVRNAADPDAALLAFLESTYAAAADLGGWDRAALECAEGQIGAPRAVG